MVRRMDGRQSVGCRCSVKLMPSCSLAQASFFFKGAEMAAHLTHSSQWADHTDEYDQWSVSEMMYAETRDEMRRNMTRALCLSKELGTHDGPKSMKLMKTLLDLQMKIESAFTEIDRKESELVRKEKYVQSLFADLRTLRKKKHNMQEAMDNHRSSYPSAHPSTYPIRSSIHPSIQPIRPSTHPSNPSKRESVLPLTHTLTIWC